MGLETKRSRNSFIARQQRDWKITVTRTSLDKLAYQVVYPYLSIYIISLGATATQLGFVTSIGLVIAGLFAPFIGWFIDRIGPKRIYLLGIGMLGISYVTYALAQNWFITILAMGAYWFGSSASTHSCATICGNCLANEDRATGMMVCETVAAGLLGMAGPLLGAWLVTVSGGVNVDGIRPLFLFASLTTVVSFLFVLTQLSTRRWKIASDSPPNLARDLVQVVQQGRHLKRWLIIASVAQLPMGMIFPFSQVFAHEIKGADGFTLGAIVTASALTSILFAIPLGRLADRVGRKQVLFVTIPLFWASNLMLVWAPAPAFLILAGMLQGFYYITSPISAAIERELVPPDQMGRWLGIARFVRMFLNAIVTFACGLMWDRLGPQYVFLVYIALDLVIRMPLLLTMPETLHMRFSQAAAVGAEGQAATGSALPVPVTTAGSTSE